MVIATHRQRGRPGVDPWTFRGPFGNIARCSRADVYAVALGLTTFAARGLLYRSLEAHYMSEKQVTETTTKKEDGFGGQEKNTVKTETKSKEGLFGGRKETTKTTETKEEE
jgi:hypothetical protein